jgi:hypothetical protein
MNPILQKIRDASTRAWLTFTQALNAIAVSLVGGALVVSTSYPDVVRSVISGAPKPLQIVILMVFGVLVHLALRQAKKAGA